jgi:hypothetical protein
MLSSALRRSAGKLIFQRFSALLCNDRQEADALGAGRCFKISKNMLLCSEAQGADERGGDNITCFV